MHHAPLPLPWIDSLFARLVTTWGRDFLAQYEGIDISLVKADWAERLGGFTVVIEGKASAPAVAYALDRLPDRPVNALQFRKLCLGYTPPTQLALPGAPANMPEKVREVMAKLAEPVSDEPTRVRWARQYIAKFGGYPKLIARRQAHLRDALAIVASYERELERQRKASAEKQQQDQQVPA